jgi:NarL family two-component system response regulator LiaR
VSDVNIVLVDDHQMLRAGVRDFLGSVPGYRIVGEASTAREALVIVDRQKPDVVLMDIVLPGMDGIVATREVLRRVPGARVIVLTAHAQIQDVLDAIDAGAIGYVLKADPPDTLMQALDQSARGLPYLAPMLSRTFRVALEASREKRSVLDILSQREREIFRLAADCRTAAEIARDLCIARKTVDAHLYRIHRKLGLRDRANLVRLAARIGLVHSLRDVVPRPAPVDGADGRIRVTDRSAQTEERSTRPPLGATRSWRA